MFSNYCYTYMGMPNTIQQHNKSQYNTINNQKTQ